MIGLLPIKGREHLRRIYDTDSVSVTIPSSRGGSHMPKFLVAKDKIRIRRLTPREVFRVMDFTDEEFDKASKDCADTNLYNQAGNSICVNCLVAIFGQMIPGKEDIYRKEKE